VFILTLLPAGLLIGILICFPVVFLISLHLGFRINFIGHFVLYVLFNPSGTCFTALPVR
jgi:hypothetical protein